MTLKLQTISTRDSHFFANRIIKHVELSARQLCHCGDAHIHVDRDYGDCREL